jgi:peptide chain release factor 1
LVATAQTRSRQNSYNLAIQNIKETLDADAKRRYNNSIASTRKDQVGSGMRGDKIRTYRFQDDRVQDHITQKVASTKKVLQGNFDLLWS